MAYGTFIDDILEHNRMGGIEVAKKYRASFHRLLSGNIGNRGLKPQNQTDYGLLDQITSQPIMVAGRVRQANVVEPADGTVAQGKVYLKQLAGSMGWDLETLENTSGDTELHNAVLGGWDRFLNGFAGVLNAIDFGDGTGRLARVSANTDNTSYYTVTVDNTSKDFGWNKLALVEDGMLVDILTVNGITHSAAWTKKVIRGEVYGVNKSAGTFNVRAISGVTNSALTAVPANSDVVFLAGAVTLDATPHWNSWDVPMGLHGLLDDGGSAGHEFHDDAGYHNGSYYGATWQGLDRSAAANSMFRALVRRPTDWYSASDNSALCPATLETLFSTFDQLFMSGATPDPESLLVLCSPPSGRWLEDRVVARQNGMQTIPANGHLLAGLVMSGFKVNAGSREILVPLKTDFAIPDGRFLIVDMGRIGIWEKMRLQGISPEGAGSLQFATPGSRALTIERWGRTRYNVYSPRVDGCAVVDGIDIAA